MDDIKLVGTFEKGAKSWKKKHGDYATDVFVRSKAEEKNCLLETKCHLTKRTIQHSSANGAKRKPHYTNVSERRKT